MKTFNHYACKSAGRVEIKLHPIESPTFPQKAIRQDAKNFEAQLYELLPADSYETIRSAMLERMYQSLVEVNCKDVADSFMEFYNELTEAMQV